MEREQRDGTAGAAAGAGSAVGPGVPVAAAERVEVLDVLRGFAVFGILVVNAFLFFSPLYLGAAPEIWWPSRGDEIARTAVLVLAQGKFYALFSFLFGLGFAIQLERAEARGAAAGRFFARRMGWLLAFGLLHVGLLWYGDILALYAVVGLALIPFRGRSVRAIRRWIVALVAVPLLLSVTVVGVVGLARLAEASAAEIARAFAEQRSAVLDGIEATRLAYLEGGLGTILATRLGEWASMLAFGALTFVPQILALFLLGLVAGRAHLFRDLDARAAAFRRAAPWLLAGGVAGSAMLVAGHRLADPVAPSPATLLSLTGQLLGAPALSAFYVVAIVLWFRTPGGRRVLAPLAPVGRMALTSYLTHSVVFTTLAYGYGFGLYGLVSPGAALGLAVLVFAIQVPLSAWWLARFRFGPAEWLWRSLTYGRVQPMRARPAPAAIIPGS